MVCADKLAMAHFVSFSCPPPTSPPTGAHSRPSSISPIEARRASCAPFPKRTPRYNPIYSNVKSGRHCGYAHCKSQSAAINPSATLRLNINSLIDIAALMIATVWPHRSNSPPVRLAFIRNFIDITLRRSRTSLPTFVLAVLYLFRAKGCIDAQQPQQAPPPPPGDPIRCGHRMMVAAIILANKFLQDRNYSNRAWAKITGMTVAEINLVETTLLRLVDYRLFVNADVYERWSALLVSQTELLKSATNNSLGKSMTREHRRERKDTREYTLPSPTPVATTADWNISPYNTSILSASPDFSLYSYKAAAPIQLPPTPPSSVASPVHSMYHPRALASPYEASALAAQMPNPSNGVSLPFPQRISTEGKIILPPLLIPSYQSSTLVPPSLPPHLFAPPSVVLPSFTPSLDLTSTATSVINYST
ncbi:uncharacterized protein VTP21DRAFT_57 [Calcarisporiella thermophila]|uniref:uncharacterized protein n=1 Tax=Calcarisporiella thermophila TaxID=911321 RepID=UPI00374366DC